MPSTFEVFKAALSTTTGAKFGHSAPGPTTTPSSGAADTFLNERYVSHPPRVITPANNTCSNVSDGMAVPSDFVLCRLSSTSSSCSSSSSSSFTEDNAMPTLRKQSSVPSLKRFVHQYEEVDTPADGNGMSISPSTSPFTYAASNSPAGDNILAGNGSRRTISNSSSSEDAALPSAAGRTKSVPLSTANTSSSLAQAGVAEEHKLATVYENVNPHQRYDFVPLHQESLHAGTLQGNWDLPEGSTHLSFASRSGEEVLYDVPRSRHGGTSPPQALSGPSVCRGMYENVQRGPFENVQCGPYENVPGSWEENDGNLSRKFHILLPPSSSSTTTKPLHHQYVNLVGLTQQLVQDMPVAGDGIQHVGRALPSLAVVSRPKTADHGTSSTTILEGDYIPMSTSGPQVWPSSQDYFASSQPYSMQQQLDGRLEPGEEEEGGYVTMRRQTTCSSSARDPTSVQGGTREGDKARGVRAGV